MVTNIEIFTQLTASQPMNKTYSYNPHLTTLIAQGKIALTTICKETKSLINKRDANPRNITLYPSHMKTHLSAFIANKIDCYKKGNFAGIKIFFSTYFGSIAFANRLIKVFD
jgi:hypothetical protein